VLIMRADHPNLTADEVADLRRRLETVLARPTVRTLTLPGLIA